MKIDDILYHPRCYQSSFLGFLGKTSEKIHQQMPPLKLAHTASRKFSGSCSGRLFFEIVFLVALPKRDIWLSLEMWVSDIWYQIQLLCFRLYLPKMSFLALCIVAFSAVGFLHHLGNFEGKLSSYDCQADKKEATWKTSWQIARFSYFQQSYTGGHV